MLAIEKRSGLFPEASVTKKSFIRLPTWLLIAEEESFVVAVEGSVAAVVGRAGVDVKNNNFFFFITDEDAKKQSVRSWQAFPSSNLD